MSLEYIIRRQGKQGGHFLFFNLHLCIFVSGCICCSFCKIDIIYFADSLGCMVKKNINKVQLIHFEHHFDDMLIKNYKFSEIHNFLIKNNFEKVLKFKMFFRKTFEYIYKNKNFK